MPTIRIQQQHTLSQQMARVAAQKVADQMAREYDMQTEWSGDVLTFKRSGVSGTLVLQESQACVDIVLGFLFSAFSSQIEEQVTKKMRKVFGEAA